MKRVGDILQDMIRRGVVGQTLKAEEPLINKASELAKWLIKTKDVKPTQAYIIAARKYKIENWHEVQRYYNQRLKARQIKLI